MEKCEIIWAALCALFASFLTSKLSPVSLLLSGVAVEVTASGGLMHLGKRLMVGVLIAGLGGSLTGFTALAKSESEAPLPGFNIEEIIGKPRKPVQSADQGSEELVSEGIITERLSPEMFDEIDQAFQKHFQLATGPTPQALLKQLAPPARVLQHELKEEFCRYGILSAQYASYGKPKEAMSVYGWLEKHYKDILAPNSSFFKEVSCAVGLYLSVAGDYSDSNTCLENALQQPFKVKDEKQRVAFVMTNFGLARNYHKLGYQQQALKYLAQAKAVNDIVKGGGVTLSPPSQSIRSGYVPR